MQITTLTSTVSDNFFYAIEDEGDLLLIDPVDAELALRHAHQLQPRRVRVLATHGHPDHVMGNDRVKGALDCEVLASGHARTFPVPCDVALSDGDVVQVGASRWRVRHAPGHTDGHLVLQHPGHLISGDVFFVGGTGHCKFGGNPTVLYRTYHQTLRDVPDETIFYPGHDYAARNMEFCLSVEPDNAGALALKERIRSWTREDGPFLTTLGHERSYNPFHRVDEPTLQQRMRDEHPQLWPADVTDAEATFRVLRALRDVF